MTKEKNDGRRTWSVTGHVDSCISSLLPGGDDLPEAPRYMESEEASVNVVFLYEFVPRWPSLPYIKKLMTPPHGPEPIGLQWFSLSDSPRGLQRYACSEDRLQIRGLQLRRIGQ